MSRAKLTSWTVLEWPVQAYQGSRCSLCRKQLLAGQPVVYTNKDTKCHRVCIKYWLERSYEDVQPCKEELVMANPSGVDMEAAERRFQAFRDGLLERYGIS